MPQANEKLWDDNAAVIAQYMEKLWRTPELPLMEYESAETLCAWLEAEGFAVERKFCGLPTAFKASYGKGGVTLAILAEYDAMAGLSNEASVTRRPIAGQAAGHACLHCHIGAGNTGAAVTVKRHLAASGAPGRIVVIGCPAEEILYGKIALLGEGGFAGLDAILTCHVDYQNASAAQPTLAAAMAEFAFGGVSSHAGAARNRNALDAVELAVAAIERLRAHPFPSVSVEHVIRHGGVMPNITPDRATLWLCVRDKDHAVMARTYDYIARVIKDCAALAGVAVAEGFIAATRGYLPNDTLGRALLKRLEQVGVPPYSPEDLAVMSKLAKNATGASSVISNPEIIYLAGGFDPYSQDDGEASWRVPLGRLNWEIPLQIPLHNWCTTALAGMDFSRKGALACSKAIYLAALDILHDPGLAAEAKAELESRTAGQDIAPPRYAALEDLALRPEAFWDGTWLYDRL